MLYQLTRFEANPRLMLIEVDREIRELTDPCVADIVSTGEGGCFEGCPLLRDLCMVNGVAEVRTYRYEVHVIRGSLFTWNDILQGVLYWLNEHLDPEGKMTEASRESIVRASLEHDHLPTRYEEDS